MTIRTNPHSSETAQTTARYLRVLASKLELGEVLIQSLDWRHEADYPLVGDVVTRLTLSLVLQGSYLPEDFDG